MEERNHKKYFAIKLCIFTLLAGAVFFLRAPLVVNLNYFIGGLMLLYSLEGFLFAVLYEREHFFHNGKIYLAFIDALFGLTLLIAHVSYESVCVIWATWSILRESYEIKEIVCELKHWIPRLMSGLESVVVIVFSIMLILEPGEHHAMIHAYLLLAELIFTPVVPLLDEVLEDK